MKKIALKGLLIVAAVVLLCVFFSGTLHTVTTAKARLTTARTGNLESSVTLSGTLYCGESVDVYSAARGQESLTVVTARARKGLWVRKGETLFTCEVTDYETRMETLAQEYEAKAQELMELERKNGGNLSAQEQRWMDAWSALQEAAAAVQEARVDLRVAAGIAGVALTGDRLPEDLEDETLKAAEAALQEALTRETEARAAFDRRNRLSLNEDRIAYVTQKADLTRQIEKIASDQAALRLLRERGAVITAPHDGYITECETKAGDTLAQGTAAARMTAKDAEFLARLAMGSSKAVLETGTKAELSAGGGSVTASVTAQGLAEDGTACTDVKLERADVTALGGYEALSEPNAISATMTIRSEDRTTLIPTAALRGSQGSYYIYVAEVGMDAFGGEKLTVARKTVNVLGQSGSVTSIQESLRDASIIYMEDRPLTEGCEIMQYENP